MSIKELVLTLLTILLLISLWVSQQDRLQAYDDCYMQNYQEWGSCPDLGPDGIPDKGVRDYEN
jgi:hypothetical protein